MEVVVIVVLLVLIAVSFLVVRFFRGRRPLSRERDALEAAKALAAQREREQRRYAEKAEKRLEKLRETEPANFSNMDQQETVRHGDGKLEGTWPWKDIEQGRLSRAKELVYESIKLKPYPIAEFVSPSTGEIYKATLESCSCRDYMVRHQSVGPCKHIIALGIASNMIDQQGDLVCSLLDDDNNSCGGQTVNCEVALENDNVVNSMEVQQTTNNELRFQGKRCTMCGTMKELTHKQIAALVKLYGGIITSEVVQNTDILIVGNKPPAKKVVEASKVGAIMLLEDDFRLMIDRELCETGTKDFLFNDLLELVDRLGVTYVDKRKNGGCFWIESTFISDWIAKTVTVEGSEMKYSSSSKALSGRAGYFIK